MGSGVAECAAVSGHEVVLRSRQQATADNAVASLDKSLSRAVSKGRMSEADKDAALALVTPTSELDRLADCDLVLESVVEDLTTKKHLFSELDRVCGESTVLATNTSTLAVIDMAMETGRPDRVCGIHFFNPAPSMALVELVRPLTASDTRPVSSLTTSSTASVSSLMPTAERCRMPMCAPSGGWPSGN